MEFNGRKQSMSKLKASVDIIHIAFEYNLYIISIDTASPNDVVAAV